MKRPYLKYSGPWITDDGYRVKRSVLVTADPPGAISRHWSNLLADFRRSVRRVYRELSS